jgi:hypothetical protein
MVGKIGDVYHRAAASWSPDGGLTDQSSVQKVHGQTTEA